MKVLYVIFTCSLALLGCQKSSESADRASFSNCKLPAADGYVSVSIGGFPRASYRLKAIGTVTATVIMVDFSDAVATKTPDQAYAMISGATDTFTEMSYGRFTYTLNPVKKWYRMSKASSEYKFNVGSSHLDYIKEAVALADADVDFSTTDAVVVIANPDSKTVGSYDTRGPAWIGFPGGGITVDGKEIVNGITSAYDLNTWGSIWLNHETTHTLGLVDLYAYESDSTKALDSVRFTGGYSYMGINSFKSNSPGLFAWERWVLGWLDDSQVSCVNPYSSGVVTGRLTPVESSGGIKALVIPAGDTKAVVVELRAASGLDKNIQKAGVLTYVVDSSMQTGKGPIKVYPSNTDSDPYFLQSTRTVNEYVDVENLRIDVTGLDSSGADVRVVTTNRVAM